MEGLGVISMTLGNTRTKAILVTLATLLALGQCDHPLGGLGYAGDQGGGTYSAIGMQLQPEDAEHKFGICYGASGYGSSSASLSDMMKHGSGNNVLVIKKSTVNCVFCRESAPYFGLFASSLFGSECGRNVMVITLLAPTYPEENMDCNVWPGLSGDGFKRKFVLYDPNDRGNDMFGHSRPIFYVLAPNGTVVDRVASQWNEGTPHLEPRLRAAMQAAGAKNCIDSFSNIDDTHDHDDDTLDHNDHEHDAVDMNNSTSFTTERSKGTSAHAGRLFGGEGVVSAIGWAICVFWLAINGGALW